MIRDLWTTAKEQAAAKIQNVRKTLETQLGDQTQVLEPIKNFAKVSSLISRYAGRTSFGKLSIQDPHERLRYFTSTVGSYSKRALDAMNFEVQVFGYDPERMQNNNYLMVGNHMSYIDILVTSSVQPTVFVTSVDMGEVFFLGTMAELGGSIFIERRHRGQIERDLSVMTETLEAGFNVMIYPEGTSSDGLKILPFKKSLLLSAVKAQRDVLPVCIKYVEIDGEPFGPTNCHKVAWYGDMTFAPHFFDVMKLKKVKVELHFLEPIKVTPESTRHDLARQAYEKINEVYMKDMVFAETQPEARASAIIEDVGSQLKLSLETEDAQPLSDSSAI